MTIKAKAISAKYGLLYINEAQGEGIRSTNQYVAALIFDNENSYEVNSVFSAENYARLEDENDDFGWIIGTVDNRGYFINENNKRSAYFPVMNAYLEGKTYHLVFLQVPTTPTEEETEEPEVDTDYTVVDSVSGTFDPVADSRDYMISLPDETIVVSSGLLLTITRPEPTTIFDDNNFNYYLSIITVPANTEIDRETTPILESITGTTTIGSVRLTSGTDDITFKDTVTTFIPGRPYKYVLQIYATGKNSSDPVSEPLICGFVSGTTTDCLKFSEEYQAGHLWVGDEPANVVAVQNSYSTQNFSGLQFQRIGNSGSKYLYVVAFEGDASTFETWANGGTEVNGVEEANTLQYAQIAYAEIPSGLSEPYTLKEYDATVSGTLKMELVFDEGLDDVSIELLNDGQRTYNGEDQPVSAFFNINKKAENGFVISYSVDGGEFSENASIKNVKRVGDGFYETEVDSYEIRIKIVKEGMSEYISEAFQIQVIPMDIAPVFAVIGDKTYDGTTDATDYISATIEGEIPARDHLEIISLNAVFRDPDAGENKGIAIAYRLSDSRNYSYIAVAVLYGTIVKADYGITLSGYSDAYDGEAHEIAAENVPDGITVLYSTDGSSYTPALRSYTNAGNYTLYAKAEGDNNHNEWSAEVPISISKRQVYVTGTQISDKEYDGADDVTNYIVMGTISGILEGDVVAVTPSGSYGDTVPGIYDVEISYTLSGTDANNYLAPETETIIGVISANDFEIGFENVTIDYDGNGHTIELTGTITGDVVSYSLDGTTFDLDSFPVRVAAGSYTVVAKVERTGTGTWTGSAVLTINPLPLTITGTTIDTKTYDGTTDATFVLGTVTGFLVGDSADITPSGSFPSEDAGTYDVTVSYYVANSNYVATDQTITGTIEKATINDITVENTTATYDGNPHILTVTGVREGDEVRYCNVNEDDFDEFQIEPMERTDVGSTSVYLAVRRANYNDWIPGVRYGITITPATIENVTLTGYTGTCDGNAHSINVTDPSAATDTILYSTDGENYVSEKPSFTEIGSYTVYVKVQRANYNDWTGNAIVVINAVPVADITYSLEQDGRASTGNGFRADGNAAKTTTKIYLDFASAPGALQANEISVSGATVDNVSAAEEITINNQTKYRVTVDITQSTVNQNGDGTDSRTVTVSHNGIEGGAKPITTYIVLFYCGNLPLQLYSDPPTLSDDLLMNSESVYALTGTLTSPITFSPCITQNDWTAALAYNDEHGITSLSTSMRKYTNAGGQWFAISLNKTITEIQNSVGGSQNSTFDMNYSYMSKGITYNGAMDVGEDSSECDDVLRTIFS